MVHNYKGDFFFPFLDRKKNNSLKMPIKRGAEPKYKRSIHKSERGKDEKKETH